MTVCLMYSLLEARGCSAAPSAWQPPPARRRVPRRRPPREGEV